ncbi:8341_t:CDS:2 [Dentiscutata erythropus]|uniref:8341_t:CDS:1 n=1 Tax=Dentiscutata erythropus TaxID=1348616 RepID=A0A9N9EVE6_9GLOM|nr:8341_t:CDS:2 [Dentiscutata erythropus]
MNYISKKFNPARRKAAQALKAGQYAEAIKYYNGLIENSPDSSMRCDRGEAYLFLNEYEKAKEDFDIYINKKPDDERGYYLRGIANDKLNLRGDALSDLSRALRIKDDNPLALEALKICARHNYELGNRDKAFKELNSILQLSANDTWALEIRGKMYYDNKQYQEALKDFNSFLVIQPTNVNILELRGTIYRKLNNSKDALTDYTQALRLNSHDPNILIKRSKTYLIQKRYSLTKTLNVNPNDINALSDRGKNYMALNKRNEAMSDLNKVLSINPNHVQALLTRAKLCRMQEMYHEALNDLSLAITIEPTNPKLLKSRGKIYTMINEYERAIQDLNIAIGKEKRPSSFEYRGKSFLMLGRYNEAISDFTEALNLNPKKSTEIHKEQKNYEKAIEVLTNGLENASGEKNMVHLYVVRGDINRLRKEYVESLKDLDEADLDVSLQDDPKNIFALCERGAVYRDKGNFKDAWNDIENALKLSEENEDYLE